MDVKTKQTFKIFWTHSKRYPWAVFILSVGVLLITTVDILKPVLYKVFFDQLVVSTPQDTQPLLRTLIYIFVLSLAGSLFWRMALFANNFFQPRVMSDLLNTCYEYLQNHSYRFFSDNFVGSLVTKVRRYQKSFEDIADQIFFDIGRTILIIGTTIIALIIFNRTIGFIILAWIVVYVSFAVLFNRYKLRYDLKRAAMDTKTTAQLADSATNNINLKLFTSHKKENLLFSSITHDLFKARKKSWDLGNYAEILQGSLIICLEFVVMYYALRLWQNDMMTIGGFALIQAYLGRIFEKLWTIGKHIQRIYEAIADANEMTEILLTPHEIQDSVLATSLKVKNADIEFANVTFAYNQQNIFKDFNLKISSGQKVAFIGPSGGGKSTIVKLLFRFFDIQKGEILIDGQNIAEVTQESLRKQIGLVPQEPILFHRSLFDNIAYGNPKATKDEVIKAAKLAHCHEFISRFPDKYETFVGERGVKLSGGERQRVAIARAILKNAPILVLDEATSSLDSESEYFIQDALKTLMKDKTTIVIAHRLSTIMQMDRIIVIENGKIKEEGKHEELLKAKQGTYQKLWHIQAGNYAN